MKKITVLCLALSAAAGLTACGNTEKEDKPQTVGGILLQDFQTNADGTVQEIADRILANEIIPFSGASMEVEPGYLTGFDNTEIIGFESGVMFGPVMGTIPFVGYIFDLADDTDEDAFMKNLKENANLRWNICTEAEELTIDEEEDKIFFLMSPVKFEETSE